ncbi:hypothetical protein [Duganella sp. Root198D2]|uniref:hypothetical protein n=1 Tax=Duganella sp. Root198D2 TaxID=1736489 RepID=UPI0012E339F9|nr:hypothetical protein [Duganella sp. Root198D2]
MKKFLFACVMLSLLYSSAHACSCQFTPLAQRVDEADEIFFATLQNAKVIPGDYPEKWPYIEGTFQAKKILKGTIQANDVVLSTGLGRGDCGTMMVVSAKYIIFKSKGRDSIDACSGSSVIEDFQEEEIMSKIRLLVSQRKPNLEKR